jgi:hypothetical protein
MSIISSFWNFLSAPQLPKVALGFNDTSVTLVSIKKRRGNYLLDRFADVSLPKGLLNPEFDLLNIKDMSSFVDLLTHASEQAGLLRQSRWSVALPEGTARSIIVHFDNTPTSAAELDEMIGWKVERLISIPKSQVRLIYQQIGNDKKAPKYLVSVVHEGVITQYEQAFHKLGWQAGMILPRHLSEVLWLVNLPNTKELSNRILISYNQAGFVAVAVQKDQPLMIRVVNCLPNEQENEVYRLATYYREKVLLEAPISKLQLLPVGAAPESDMTHRTFEDVFSGTQLETLTAGKLALTATNNFDFTHVAAPAALAALRYQ